MSTATNTAFPRVGPLPAARAGWLFGPLPDLLLGCGLGYVLVIGALSVFGPQLRDALSPGLLPFVSVLVGAPHYGATILRVYERREDRRSYALFAVHATLLIVALFVIATRWFWLGSLLIAIYLTWSPWHYTGQNYGLAVMFLRRRGVALDATTKRWIYAAFLLSYAVIFLALHSHAPGAQYTPPIFTADGYRPLSLDLPSAAADVAFRLALGSYVVAMTVSGFRLLRRAAFTAIAPSLALAATQALWFALPVALRRFGLFANIEPFAPEQAGWYFFWAALAHSIQYVWVTSYFARGAAGYPGLAPYLAKALLAGAAVWCIPALLFAPDVLGKIPYDAGLAALVAASVNLHHFVLDGAIWKLRDGRIARILVRSQPDPVASDASERGQPRSPWATPLRLGLWAVGATSLLVFVLSYVESEFGLQRALERGDLARMRTALVRLDTMGRESASNYLSFGRVLAGRGDSQGARREYQRSVELYATPDAWVAESEALESGGRLREAREAMDRAAALAPDSGALAYRAASLATRNGDRAAARSSLERAVALEPERKLYRVALDRLLAREGELPPDAGAPGK